MSTTIGGATGGSNMAPMDAMTQGTVGGSAAPASNPFGSATGATSGAAPFGSATGAIGGTAATTAASTSSVAGTDTFLKLLVAQMRNQDPTSPMDSQSFVTELAQFNTVEQMLGLKEAVTAQIASQQSAEGVALLGKTVTYTIQGVGSQTSSSQGVVSAVGLQGGVVRLQVGTDSVPLSTVTAVSAQ